MKKEKVVPVIQPEQDISVIGTAGMAFDPTTQHMDLSKEEKRRTTSLLLAIQAYDKLIIKDAEMYIAISRDTGRDTELKIRPATIDAIVEASIKFDLFIAGVFNAASLPPDPPDLKEQPKQP